LRPLVALSFAMFGTACGGSVAAGDSKPASVTGSGGTTSGGAPSLDANAGAGNGLQLLSLDTTEMLDLFNSNPCPGHFIVGVDDSPASADLAPYCRFLLNKTDLLPVPDGGIMGQTCAFAYPAPPGDIPLPADRTSLVYRTGDAASKFYIIEPTSATCDPAGWYLDNNGQIAFCSITCSTICQDPSALVYGLGCGGPLVQ
jgi:hypothetical protein